MPAIKKHQTTLDFVAQYGGDLEGLFDMAINNAIGITDEPEPGTSLSIEVMDLKVTRVYTGKSIDIKGKDSVTGYIRPSGIGYMQVENDFITS